MKKKLFLILSLLMFIVPVSACGEDETEESSKLNIQVSLDKAIGGTSFALNDCAEVTGGGLYNPGDRVDIVLKYVENACQFEKLVFNGTEEIDFNDEKGKFSVVKENSVVTKVTYRMYDVRDHKNIEVKMLGTGVESSKATVLFDSFNIVTDPEGVNKFDPVTDFTFPYLEYATDIPSNDLGNGSKGTINFNSIITADAGKKLSEVFGKDVNGKFHSVNLNYAYIGNTFEPYKIKWVKGTLSSGLCRDATYEIADINNEVIQSGTNNCYAAVIDKKGTSSALASAYNEAIKNMISSSVYISNVNDHACLEEVSTEAPELDKDCMFVYNMKNLYASDVNHTDESVNDKDKKANTTMYYGVLDSGEHEAVKTATSGNKEYYICSDPSDKSKCKSSTMKITYPHNGSSMLKIEDFITSFKDKDIGNFIDLKFDYNSKVNGIVLNQFTTTDGKTYYLNYISSNTKIHSQALNINGSISSGKLYEFESSDSSLDGLIGAIEMNNSNLIFEKFNEAEIRKKIYTVINKDNTFSDLKNYYFDITNENEIITITKTSATIEGLKGKDNSKYITVTDELLGDENENKTITCLISEISTDSLTCAQSYSSYISYIKKIIDLDGTSGPGIASLKDFNELNIVFGKINGEITTRTYEFKDISNKVIKIEHSIVSNDDRFEIYVTENHVLTVTFGPSDEKTIELEGTVVATTKFIEFVEVTQTFDGTDVYTYSKDEEGGIVDLDGIIKVDSTDIVYLHDKIKPKNIIKVEDNYILVIEDKSYSIKEAEFNGNKLKRFEVEYKELLYTIEIVDQQAS